MKWQTNVKNVTWIKGKIAGQTKLCTLTPLMIEMCCVVSDGKMDHVKLNVQAQVAQSKQS